MRCISARNPLLRRHLATLMAMPAEEGCARLSIRVARVKNHRTSGRQVSFRLVTEHRCAARQIVIEHKTRRKADTVFNPATNPPMTRQPSSTVFVTRSPLPDPQAPGAGPYAWIDNRSRLVLRSQEGCHIPGMGIMWRCLPPTDRGIREVTWRPTCPSRPPSIGCGAIDRPLSPGCLRSL